MVSDLAPHFVFDRFIRILFRADVLHFSCLCALCNSVFYPRSLPDIQGWQYAQDVVILYDIQYCFSILEVESICMCLIRI